MLSGVRPVKLPTRAMEEGSTPRQAEAMLKHYHVSPVRRQLAMDCAQASLAVKRSLQPEEISLYVGIPFCPTRCAYCSFISASGGWPTPSIPRNICRTPQPFKPKNPAGLGNPIP